MSTTSPSPRARKDSSKKKQRTTDDAAPESAETAAGTTSDEASTGACGPKEPAKTDSPESTSALTADLLREIYLTRPDRLPCFYEGSEPETDAEVRTASLCEAVKDLKAVDPREAKGIQKLLKRALRRDGKPTTEKHGVPKPAAAYHGETEQLSILRTDWTEGGVQLAIDWSTPAMRLEMFVGDEKILDGRMPPRVRVSGTVCEPVGPWEEICWESNVDVDYLELEIDLAGEVRLQRQIVLTRRDGCLYMADAVLPAKTANLHCELALPVVPATEFTPAVETREATAVIGKHKLLLLPLGLREWRTETSYGDLAFEGGHVALRQQAPTADALYVPLVMIYERKRAKRDCTWRRLTVGENLRLVPLNEACGYRWQLGKEHWLAYRSLTAERANRTVLGVNLQTNFLLSRFTTDGDSEPLIEIDD